MNQPLCYMGSEDVLANQTDTVPALVELPVHQRRQTYTNAYF